MTTNREGWKAQLEPAAWVTCRVTGGRPDGDSVRAEPAAAAATDTSLTLLVGWGSSGRYDHTEVIETEHVVYILVFIEYWVATIHEPGVWYTRKGGAMHDIIEVGLAVPLGVRTLLGSVGRPLIGGASVLSEWQPIDIVTSRRRSEASSEATDLIAKFEDLLLIQATHHALSDMQAKSRQDAEG